MPHWAERDMRSWLPRSLLILAVHEHSVWQLDQTSLLTRNILRQNIPVFLGLWRESWPSHPLGQQHSCWLSWLTVDSCAPVKQEGVHVHAWREGAWRRLTWQCRPSAWPVFTPMTLFPLWPQHHQEGLVQADSSVRMCLCRMECILECSRVRDC